MTEKQIYEKAQLLKAGQIVEIESDCFRAVHLNFDPPLGTCMECDLDSICRGDIFEVCCAMETLKSHNWILKLAHPL